MNQNNANPSANLPPSFTNVIRQSKLFDGVKPGYYLAELEKCHLFEAAPNDLLITVGKENKNTYFVLSGTLSIHLEKSDSPPIRHVGEGETVGELSLLGETKATAFVVVQTPSTLLMVPREVMWRLIRRSAIIAQNLLFILTDWIISDNERFLDRSREVEDLKGLSQQDGLTGLLNRRMLDNTLNRVYSRSQMCDKPFSVIMCDVDHFKAYNDQHGHKGGDCALVALADVLKEAVRPLDFVGRYGGEEFTIILPDTSLEAALVVAERLRKEVENRNIFHVDGTPLSSITLSLGIATSAPDSSVEQLIEQADQRLYQAKHGGRNRCCSG
ncbi:MAG: GGDEF domain-containing protein [Magnetococcales bacterium]|nr:GGDEF domain-containing protein [Magnetococcales bacterium]